MYFAPTGFPPVAWEEMKKVIFSGEAVEISTTPSGELLIEAIADDRPLPAIALTTEELYDAVLEKARKEGTPFPPSPGAYTTAYPYPMWVEPHRKQEG